MYTVDGNLCRAGVLIRTIRASDFKAKRPSSSTDFKICVSVGLPWSVLGS